MPDLFLLTHGPCGIDFRSTCITLSFISGCICFGVRESLLMVWVKAFGILGSGVFFVGGSDVRPVHTSDFIVRFGWHYLHISALFYENY
jgi:hypothetical protein